MLRKLVVGPYQTNCYILGCKETNQGLVIDPGDEVLRIVKEITRSSLTIKYILITHGHIDHVGGVPELKRITTGGLGARPDGFLEEGQIIQVGNYSISIIHTPGHSPGGVCLYAPGAVFSGDTLFAGSVGRTDFPGGSHELLVEGVRRKIFPLGDDLRVYPGHGPESTIGRERQTNPFFRLTR